MFPFIDNVYYLLMNDELMEHSKRCYNEHNDTCGDLNTGDWWHVVETNLFQKLVRHSVTNAHLHYLVPVILFTDTTHCDNKGHLSAEPVLCMIGNIALEHCKKPTASLILG